MAERHSFRPRSKRRDERADAAKRHIAYVQERFSTDVERSLAELTVYAEIPELKGGGVVPEVVVSDQDSVSAVLERGRGLASACDLALLDFASFVNPGGGYESGAWAQEEAICAESTLYNVLREQKTWYAENRSRNLNCSLFRHRGLAVPKVRFERDGYHSYADVIVVAAPNLRRAREEYRVEDKEAIAAMKNRIRLVLGIADDLGHETLILGAYGCGVFGWDAAVVAEMFREELASGAHLAKTVVFAIPSSRFDENLPLFEHAFATFPEKNGGTYLSPAERLAAEEQTQQAEDDDDDEDWRKYIKNA